MDQVGAFKDRSNADKLCRELSGKGRPAFVAAATRASIEAMRCL